MRVICRINSPEEFKNEQTKIRLRAEGLSILEIGAVYTVYAIIFENNRPQILISLYKTESGYSYRFEPLDYFEIIDDRFSMLWKFNYFVFDERVIGILGFPELADNIHFYEKLFDYDENALKIADKYKRLMDREYFQRSKL